MHDGIAFVGLSRIREISTFNGVPIAERRESLKCGVAIVDLTDGRTLATLEFETGVEEIFDIQLLTGCCDPAVSGPFAAVEGRETIWKVPVS